MRFGLDDGSEHTLEEAASPFAGTRERIRQIEAKRCASCGIVPFAQTARLPRKVLRATTLEKYEFHETRRPEFQGVVVFGEIGRGSHRPCRRRGTTQCKLRKRTNEARSDCLPGY